MDKDIQVPIQSTRDIAAENLTGPKWTHSCGVLSMRFGSEAELKDTYSDPWDLGQNL